MKENDLTQLSLTLAERGIGPDDKTDSVIASYPTLLKAIRVSIEVSGLQDQHVAEILGTSIGNLSKYLSGTYNFPLERLPELAAGTGNDIPLRWLALKRGYALVPLKSTVEEERDEALARADALERKLNTITEFCKQIGVRA